jgi:tRNA/tmRNA/rRNA uracil-C5-methylase (TrmA/RlmC/RlmD family)
MGTEPGHVETPVKLGDRKTITIDDIGFGGEGVARLGNFVLFVPFVMVGETVEAEITEVKKHFGRGRLIKVLQASPQRVEPRCRYFTECGGCQYQHISYPTQLEIKQKQIADLFERVGGFAGRVVLPVIGCPQPYGYRNRIMIRSQWNKPLQKLDIGYIRDDNRLVVDIEECPIAEPEVSDQIKAVRAKPPPKGGIKVTLRRMPEGWDLHPDSFFQNNFHLLPKLVETVRQCVQSGGNKYLIDAYCGVGFFSIETADLVTAFVGVELDVQAVRSARKNATTRNITNGEYVYGRAESLLPDILLRYPATQTTLVLDPPRTGCPPESLQAMRDAGVAQILYVSCHPATLARDLKLLCADGHYELKNVQPLDMFPQTQHVECVADVRKVK